MPIFFMRLANLTEDGSMCGSGDFSSAMSSMSKNRAPGMCPARYSALASRPLVGRCMEPSRTTRPGVSRWEASQSVSTSHRSAPVVMRFLSLLSLSQRHADAPVELALLLDLGDD